jgi:predicted CXXCH cytochrome family protein
MKGSMNAQDVFGTDLSTVHPFNFNISNGGLQCTTDMFVCQSTSPSNPAVKLISGNVQCTTCHEPHIQGIDPVAQQFLVMNNAGSALCLACHSPVPSETISAVKKTSSTTAQAAAASGASSTAGTGASSVSNANPKYRAMGVWPKSIHAIAAYKVSRGAQLGPYPSLKENGCLSCHKPHNANGKALLTGPVKPVPNLDAGTQNCIMCHNGSSNITPEIPSVWAEFEKTGHPFPTEMNKHTPGEPAVLDNNRHTTCVDCHDPHASQKTGSFISTEIRPSQTGALGVSARDGSTPVVPAKDQYETCLRCHGTSARKQKLPQFGYLPTRVVTAGDPLNLIPQFAKTATSAHPVMYDRSVGLPQPSLLQYMWNEDGKTQERRLGIRILCSDCHNSDDNREFGGSGPNGPHGSRYSHILERRYEFSRVQPAPAGGPGTTIVNLFPNPSLSPDCASYPCASPYALCAKCHDLNNIVANRSFSQHARHINDGFSCSTCHTAHGVGAVSANVSGERLVDFDAAVVASNGGVPISYFRGRNSCVLTCHNAQHNSDGSVTVSTGPKRPWQKR